MPPKKKQKTLVTTIPNDVQWCLDRANCLSFKNFIETFDCLDRHQAQQRYTNILSKYFNTNSERDRTIHSNYKSWIKSADYLRFWGKKKDSTNVMKADLAGAELIGSSLDLRLAPIDENIPATITEIDNSVQQATADCSKAIGSTRVPHDGGNTIETKLAINDDVIILHEDISPVCNPDNPWMFKNTNVTQLFKSYQAIIRRMIHKHQTLPIESYIHELAAHTHTFVLCKNQQSLIAERVFSKSLLTDLTTELVSEVVDLNQPFPQEDLFTLTTTLSNLALGTTDREQTMLDLYNMASKMAYGPKRIVRGVANLLQKLPTVSLKSHDAISETELWNTYYDPVLSCLVSDPDKLVHLRWTNSLPNENGNCRPDAVISIKPHLEFTNSIGFGEVKVNQRSGARYSLCVDTLRLITFCKNAIDVNKLDGAIAFQIHGMHITFFLMRLVATGLYTFVEIAHLNFAESVENLPSFCTLVNFKKLLAINDVFWRYCKESAQPEKIEARYAKTLTTLSDLIEEKQDSSRSCVLRYEQ